MYSSGEIFVQGSGNVLVKNGLLPLSTKFVKRRPKDLANLPFSDRKSVSFRKIIRFTLPFTFAFIIKSLMNFDCEIQKVIKQLVKNEGLVMDAKTFSLIMRICLD